MASRKVALFLFFIMTVSLMKNSVLLAIYHYDTALFVSMLCENKQRPQLHCNGQCQLAKMQQEEEKKQTGSVLQHMPSDVLYYNSTIVLEFKPVDDFGSQTKVKVTPRKQFYSFLYTTDLVKPPELA